MKDINDYPIEKEIRGALLVLLAYVEDWNKLDRDKVVAQAAGDIQDWLDALEIERATFSEEIKKHT